jgi:hypothetical protein
MRVPSVPALSAALSLLACARVAPLQAVDPTQAIEGVGNEAQAEVAGVTARVQIGGWRGRPQDLEQRLTPVDVTLHNLSGHTVRIGPEAFVLQTPSGTRRALDQAEVAWQLRQGSGPRDHRVGGPRVGAVGGPTFPGYDSGTNPYAPWARSPPGSPVPAASQFYDMQSPAGTLANGAKTSILLFFGTPVRSLLSATFEIELVDDESGAQLGTLRLPFARD